MIILNILIILFLVNMVRILMVESQLWQRKEYRRDRMVSFFRTNEGKIFLLHPFIFLKWILFFEILLFENYVDPFFFYIFAGLVVLDLLFGLKSFRRPKFTLRSGAVILLSLFLLAGVFKITNKYLCFEYLCILSFLLVDRFIFLGVSLSVLITSIPSYIYIKYLAFNARKKIERYPNLIVIGITGSFGKTTTKEFLATILSKKYTVLKTEGTNNTEIGIAQTILKKLTSDTQIFIVEMGAYKRGEIRALCNLVHPQIGVLTGINSEHVELFGSIENTMKAKYELVQGLTENGTVFLNGNSKSLNQISHWIERDRKGLKKFWYGEVPQKDKKNNIDVKNVKSELTSLSFEICWKEKYFECKTTFGGEQFIQNISCGVSLALLLGLSFSEIQKGISDLTVPNNRMNLMKYGSVYIVDDTYNSNPDGVLYGLKYLSQFHGKKWFVFSPIIELSKEGNKIHQEISKEAQKVCDRIFLTNNNYSKEFLGNEKDKIYVIDKQKQLDSYVIDKTEEIMIYFSGREAKRQMELILKKIK